MATRFLALTVLSLVALGPRAQFLDVSSMLGGPILSLANCDGHAMSFHDFDRDGWDDLSIAQGAGDPVFLRNVGGTLEPAPFTIPNPQMAPINMLLWADTDNDGDSDLLITKYNAPLQLWRNDGNWQFTNISLQSGLEQAYYRYFGAAFCDYDHDGLLDLYITKYHSFLDLPFPQYSSILYRNTGNNTFADVTQSAGVFLLPHPAFQPVFLDYDHDGWEDLFLVVDRLPHRNELFRNNGNGTFTNVTDESQMGLTICSMTGTVGDYDQDLDLDVFISNNPPIGQVLMRNEGNGTFEDVSQAMGVGVVISGWGGQWIDHDNDTWEDLFMGNTHGIPPYPGNLLFRNVEGQAFDMDNSVLGPGGDLIQTYACAKGDLDNDGYFDMALNNRFPQPASLHHNQGDGNHWYCLTLQGTLSNRDGVGTWVHCHAGGQVQTRFTLCGSDLVTQNSSKIIFGLGGTPVIDSLVIEWNRGTREVYHNLPANECRHYVEGASLTPAAVTIAYEGLPYLCPGGSIVLDAGEYAGYLWNTGHTGRYLTVTTPGTYFVTISTTYGFQVTSAPVTIVEAPPLVMEVDVQPITCSGASDGSITATFNNEPIQSILWNNGAQTHAISGLAPGGYSFVVVDAFGCTGIGGAFLEEPLPLMVDVSTTNATAAGNDGSAAVTVTGGVPGYTLVWSTGAAGTWSIDGLAPGAYSVTVTDANGCTQEVPFTIGSSIDVDEHGLPRFRLRPNPAGDLLWADGCDGRVFAFRMTDARGAIVMERAAHPCIEPIPLGWLAPGAYLLSIQWGAAGQVIRLPFVHTAP